MRKTLVYVRIRSVILNYQQERDRCVKRVEEYLHKGQDIEALGQQIRAYTYDNCIQMLSAELDSLLGSENDKEQED